MEDIEVIQEKWASCKEYIDFIHLFLPGSGWMLFTFKGHVQSYSFQMDEGGFFTVTDEGDKTFSLKHIMGEAEYFLLLPNVPKI